jgi:hypothetical protein
MRLLDKMQGNKREETGVKIDDPINLPAMLQKINDILLSENNESKSNISHENAQGMIQAMNFNLFIEETCGKEFRITVLDRLVFDKCRYILSVDGMGSDKVLKGLNSLQPVISSNMPPSFTEYLLAGNKSREVKKNE